MILIRQGSATRFEAIGLADRKAERPMRRDQTWRVASLTKVVTGVVVLQLLRERKLRLDDLIGRHVRIANKGAARSTIRQLLQHTSGIPDYMAHPTSPVQLSAAALVSDLRTTRDPDALLRLAFAMDKPSDFGTKHHYSNSNYVLLGRLIEKIGNQSFADSIRTRVIEPLGLTSTGFPDVRGRLREDAVRGYIPADSAAGPYTNFAQLLDVTEHTNFLGADGGLYASIDDVARLLSELSKGQLLSHSELARMTGGMVEDHDGFYRYGLGIAAFPTTCRKIVYGHEGRDLGVFTLALSDFKSDRQLVLVLNRSADSFTDLDRAISAIRDAVFCNNTAK